jgi:hypothetical protein
MSERQLETFFLDKGTICINAQCCNPSQFFHVLEEKYASPASPQMLLPYTMLGVNKLKPGPAIWTLVCMLIQV